MAHALLTGAIVVALAAVLAYPSTASTRPHEGNRAVAGFLVNCALFVDWPSGGESDLTIGIAGAGAVAALVREVEGRVVNGRTLRVRTVGSAEEAIRVNLLYIGGDAPPLDVRTTMADGPVLTVGDARRFTAEGGMIRLYSDDGRLRFEVNMTAVERTGLKISSKMLGVARIVR